MLLLAAAHPAIATTLKGVVVKDETGGATVAGVVITSPGANRNVTLADGQFKLDFPDNKAGDTVRVFVSKDGYVVVNDVQLEQKLPSNPDASPLVIIVCAKEKREGMARRFYRLKSLDTIEEYYQKRLKEFEDAHTADARIIEDLKAQRELARAAATKAADELAKDDTQNASALYQQAMRLFLDGKTQEAIGVLNDEALKDSLAKAKEKQAAAEKMEREAKDFIAQATRAWVLKGQLFTLQFKFSEADRAYKAAIDASPDDYNANFSYGLFNQQLNRFPQAELAYKNSLRVARMGAEKNPDAYLPDVAAALNNLADVEFNETKNDSIESIEKHAEKRQEAASQYDEALKIYRQLALKNPNAYLPDVAVTLFNSRQYEEALKIYRQLAQDDPKTYLPYVAVCLTGLASSHVHATLVMRGKPETEEMRTARKAFEEAAGIYRQLGSKDDETLANEAMMLHNLANLDSQTEGKTAEAKQNYDSSVKILRQLAERNPEAYLPELAHTLHSTGLFYMWQGPEESKRQAFADELAACQRLSELAPGQYDERIGWLKHQLEDKSKQ